MAKADLVRDAKARGLTLTGDETVAELEALLEAAGESAADVEAKADFVEPLPLPVVGKQYLVEGSAEPRDIPADVLADSGQYPRRIMMNGSSYEHVSDAPGVDAEGKPAVAWVYRKM